MSRIGKRPIKIEEGVNVEITGSKVVASSADKKLELNIPSTISVKKVEDQLVVERKDDSKEARSFHGLTARLLRNIIVGVKDGFSRELTFFGTGYRVAVDNNEVALSMGYSHEIRLAIPEGLAVVIKKNSIIVSGDNKQKVGQLAAEIRAVRPPEVYKGKGIKYKEEIIRRKAGKKAAS